MSCNRECAHSWCASLQVGPWNVHPVTPCSVVWYQASPTVNAEACTPEQDTTRTSDWGTIMQRMRGAGREYGRHTGLRGGWRPQQASQLELLQNLDGSGDAGVTLFFSSLFVPAHRAPACQCSSSQWCGLSSVYF